ncbi:hypothetical protein F5050DRAFT_1716351, partial [Lentinula boryana]
KSVSYQLTLYASDYWKNRLSAIIQKLFSSEPQVCLKNELDNAAATVLNYRKYILVSLGCDVADEQCMQAIATNEAKQFWSYVGEVKRRNMTVANTKKSHSLLHVARPELDGPEDTSSSDLTAILVQQCMDLDELAGHLRHLKGFGRVENTLIKQCVHLCSLARTLK